MSIVLFRSVDFETSKMTDGCVIEAGRTDVWLDTDTRRCEIADPKSKLFGLVGEMDPGAQGTHHILQEELDGLPPLDDGDLRELIEGADFLVAHNRSYEQAFLTEEITGGARWVCTMKCARRAWEEAPEYGLQALRYWRGLRLPPELSLPAHRGGPDSFVGAHLFAELAKTEAVNDLVKWTKAPMHYTRCPIGKHKDQVWSEIPYSYLQWITSGANDLEFDIKFAARTELNRRAEGGAR